MEEEALMKVKKNIIPTVKISMENFSSELVKAKEGISEPEIDSE